MNENYNTPNSGCCGRPMHYTTKPKCGQNHCCFNEYNYKMNACIRKQQPDCSAQAVIPAVTVETVSCLADYINCFVHVTSNNTTYYVNEKGAPIITWKGDVEAQIPPEVQSDGDWREFLRSFELKSQFLYVRFYNNDENKYRIEAFYYDNAGRIFWAGEFEDTEIGG